MNLRAKSVLMSFVMTAKTTDVIVKFVTTTHVMIADFVQIFTAVTSTRVQTVNCLKIAVNVARSHLCTVSGSKPYVPTVQK